MKKHLKTLSTITVAYLAGITSNAAVAQHAAHVHGHAELTMAIESNRIQLQLISPAEAIVGFEYKAKTEQEVHQVTQARKLLLSSENLIQFIGTNCQITDSKVNTEDLLPVDEHHDHDSHNHDHEHEKHDHNEHNHQEHDEHDHESHDDHDAHAEVSVDYSFECKDTNKISSATVSLFKHFPALEKVQVIWLTTTKQGSVTTTARNNSLDIN